MAMFDCASDVLGYHDEKVTLAKPEQDEMRDRRGANRDRLKKGLEKAEKPAPKEFNSQGSYSMKTMTQDAAKDYDIDDGVYFEKDKLKGPRGGEMTALEARQMVRDALDDGSFKTPPKLHTNCVRVQYGAGYQVDVPVYRRVSTEEAGKESIHYELASSEWKRSDARDVTAWFDDENQKQSPDEVNGRQLRRITRLIKKFAKSRSSWKPQTLSGFGITILVVEQYRKSADREDSSVYDTMKAIRDRLNGSLVINNPVTPNEAVTNGTDDSKAKFFRDRLSDAIRWLEPLFESDCTQVKARKCWDDVYDTSYFSDLNPKKEKASSAGAEQVLTAGLVRDIATGAHVAVNKAGGGRYA
ncbi:hypothetical protein Pan44_10100 [Caulifigura coniformis]|uniref:Cyclic GMP-AMP synthase n=1 Tax=Caulifigura coniformis TaxID=2527983 RepID=A0A517SA26_9PLAN|nr:hypothetical protein [Caulifigura coniformis]QDT52995.1 hypothetical protein Pan44_10100 [Caulifigura coniformis]